MPASTVMRDGRRNQEKAGKDNFFPYKVVYHEVDAGGENRRLVRFRLRIFKKTGKELR